MPFPCDLCTKSYLYPYELRNHKTSIHFKEEKTAEKKTTEEKRVKCDRVVKKKGRRMQLYRCKLCPQQFTTSRKIRVHMTSHTGIYLIYLRIQTKFIIIFDILLRM